MIKINWSIYDIRKWSNLTAASKKFGNTTRLNYETANPSAIHYFTDHQPSHIKKNKRGAKIELASALKLNLDLLTLSVE